MLYFWCYYIILTLAFLYLFSRRWLSDTESAKTPAMPEGPFRNVFFSSRSSQRGMQLVLHFTDGMLSLECLFLVRMVCEALSLLEHRWHLGKHCRESGLLINKRGEDWEHCSSCQPDVSVSPKLDWATFILWMNTHLGCMTVNAHITLDFYNKLWGAMGWYKSWLHWLPKECCDWFRNTQDDRNHHTSSFIQAQEGGRSINPRAGGSVPCSAHIAMWMGDC